jgi:hypothetical protein
MLDLYKKDEKDRKLAQELISDPMFLDEFINNFYKQKCAARYKDFKALHLVSEENPEILYKYWDDFVAFFHSGNNSLVFYGIHIITNLLCVDKNKKFTKIFEDYFMFLEGTDLIPACHIASTSWKIVLAYPGLEQKVTEKLLNTSNSSHQHREIICANVIESFLKYFGKSNFKESIIEFVENFKDSKSLKARKAVKDFILKYEF